MNEGGHERNFAPWGSKSRMRFLWVTTCALSIILIVIGVIELSGSSAKGWYSVILGVVLLCVMAIMGRSARSRDRV